MCKIIESSLGSAQSQSLRSDSQAAYKMENPADVPRVKFLCSFGGTILPRPMDGKLRYVGGDTRIVSVARIVGFTELMTKMKELFESASLLKYQQPDEDLDALVSVVNDEDVVNMMEEYDKLGQNDGLTRLRIFLFSHTDDADSSIFDMDGRESQRRYVDALNSLNDPSDFSRPAEMGDQTESFPLAEQFFHSVHLDRMRNYEVMASQYNGHQFSVLPPPLIGHYNGPVVFQDHEMGFPGVPHIAATLAMVSGREVPSQAHTPRYNEMEVPWSPAFHSSSGHLPSHESRLVSDFSSSPSGPRGRMGFDIHDTTFEECSSNGLHMAGAYAATGDQAVYDHLSVPVDNPLLMQQSNPVLGDSNKFQLNANTRKTPCDGSSKCEHCHLSFPRNQTVVESHCTDGRWRHTAAYLDHAHEVNKVCCHCKECFFWKEGDPLNLKDNEAFLREKQESEHNLADLYGHERGPIQPMNHWAEETRSHISGSRRINERYTHLPYGNSCESHPLPLIQMNQEDLHISHHVHAVSEFKGEDIHENIRGTAHKRAPLLDDLVTKYENFSDPIGKDDCFCPPEPAYSLQKTGQTVGRGTSPSELSGLPTHTNGAMTTGFLRATPVGSPRLLGNNENPTVVQDANLYTANPFGASVTDHALSIKRNIVNDCNHTLLHLVGDRELSTGVPREAETDAGTNFANGLKPSNLTQNGSISNLLHRLSTQPQQDLLCFPENIDSRQIPLSSSLRKSDASASLASSNCQTMPWSNLNITKEQSLLKQDTTSKDSHRSHKVSAQTDPPKCNCDSPDCYVEEVVLKSVSAMGDVIKNESNDVLHVSNKVELSAECLKLIPELMASVKKAKLEGIQQIQVQENGDANHVDGQENDHAGVPSNIHGSERSFIHEIEPDEELNNDNPTSPKIEETKAEEEALEKGLQTIKNCDLEEVRELGSGTYGSVYHGKWRGSDVAIKRIKPSCFAGKPSERERLIGDFWKEALILSSLHHPNVVSFYGVVRDGPGGSLATVTEFMVNGSLKQVLQRKDRTIDRRKRLIIAMDASFGMEYLHEKKIVHFDLKCENLLVNMKDPHRPVCKIGDLGLSKVRQHTLVSGGVRGTLPWMAPELLSGKSNMVTEKIDVYSFGIVMWEVLTGGEPYADMHSAAIIGGIVNNSLRPQIPPWCDPEWKSLMESCWSSDPGHRPSFAEISQALRKMFAALNVK